jgi:hypothetical protein
MFSLNCLPEDVLATVELYRYVIEAPLSAHIVYGREVKTFGVPLTVTTVPDAVESKPFCAKVTKYCVT